MTCTGPDNAELVDGYIVALLAMVEEPEAAYQLVKTRAGR